MLEEHGEDEDDTEGEDDMSGTKITDAERADILERHGKGQRTAEIVAAIGRTQPTVSRVIREGTGIVRAPRPRHKLAEVERQEDGALVIRKATRPAPQRPATAPARTRARPEPAPASTALATALDGWAGVQVLAVLRAERERLRRVLDSVEATIAVLEST